MGWLWLYPEIKIRDLDNRDILIFVSGSAMLCLSTCVCKRRKKGSLPVIEFRAVRNTTYICNAMLTYGGRVARSSSSDNVGRWLEPQSGHRPT